MQLTYGNLVDVIRKKQLKWIWQMLMDSKMAFSGSNVY